MTTRQRKRVAVVLPVGPRDAEGALDTLASALAYLDESRIIVVVDDTGGRGDFAQRAREMSQDVAVFPASALAHGTLGELWVKQAAAYQWLLERYEPDLVMRLDSDALILGAGIEELAAREFAKDEKVGLLGSYRIRADGEPRDWSWPARRLRIEAGPRGLRDPARRGRLRELIALARQHGYVDGEHALGACYIHTFAAVAEIYAKGWFRETYFATSRLGDDHLMGLLTVAAGYRLADFGRPEDPIALTWKGLPSHPDELLARKKLVTHSVKTWESLNEAEIRGIFKAARQEVTGHGTSGEPALR
jgi:hypothetical protein